MGNGEWGMGNGEWGLGTGDWGLGKSFPNSFDEHNLRQYSSVKGYWQQFWVFETR
ncbi:hypothetical protein [Nostoc sp.]